MTWTKLCDNIFADPRLLRVRAEVGHCAALLHIEALVYSNRVGTDGRIDRWCLPAVTSMPPRDVARWVEGLVAAGVWTETETGWQVVSGIADQPTAEQIAAKRAEVSAARSAAGKAGAKARWADGKMANGMAKPSQSHSKREWQSDGPVPTRPVPDQSKEEKTPPPPVAGAARRVADETAPPRAVEAPSAPAPTRPATHRHDLPAVAVEESLLAATGGRLRLAAAPAPIGAAIVERLRREGVTVEELPRVAAVIGADGGRLLWPWPADLRITPEALARPALPDGGGWGCERVGEAVSAARDGGVEALRRRAATSTRPARAGDKLAHLRAPMARPEDFARDAAAIEATKIQDPAERRAALAAIGVAEADAPF